MKNKFLPICKKDMDERGIQQLDFVYVIAMPMLTIHPLDMPSSAGYWKHMDIPLGSFHSRTGKMITVFLF